MRPRSEFHKFLVGLMGPDIPIYHQAPPNTGMKYPCVVYRKSAENRMFADNFPYSRENRWQVTYITMSPKDETFDKLGELPLSVFDRYFIADNLHHHSYVIYY